MRAALLSWCGLLCLALVSDVQAHIGTLNAVFEGLAGNTPVRVVVRPPGVVPGLAQIDVRILSGEAQRVTVLPVHWRAGLEGSPPPDVAQPVAGEPGLFHAELWLMARGAYSVHVQVETAAGSGKVIVPVNSLATTRLSLSPMLGVLLVLLGVLLFSLAISVVGAAVRESVLEPGLAPSSRRRWLGRGAVVAAALLLTTALWGGRSWWNNVDQDYRHNRMFKPVKVQAETRLESGQHVLRVHINDKDPGSWAPLVPDHGKLMHLFLIREPALDAFAHLHPVRQRTDIFESALPPLPAGRYRLYADVTHETGFAQTLTATVDLPEALAEPASVTATTVATAKLALSPDTDDSFHVVEGAAPVSGAAAFSLGDGWQLKWDQPAHLNEDEPVSLRFRVTNETDQPATLEPYMGMLSHLILTRDDGAVFTHLHPAGTISMASQQVFQIRAGERPPKRITPEMMEKLCQAPRPELTRLPFSFPYEFPEPGRYSFWVQVKIAGKIRTGRFTAEVLARGKKG